MQKPNQKHNCDQCSSSYTRLWDLNRHKQVHEGLDYICETCSKVFKQKRYLISHINKIHKGATTRTYIYTNARKHIYKCKKNIPLRRNHMKTHQEATKKYSCDICSNIYKSRSALNNHLQVHEGIEYTCNHCTKTFLKKSYLKAHLQNHEGVTYPCDKCPKTFSRRQVLRRHQWIVHEGIKGNKGPMKQYECFHCGKRYYSRQNFTIHILKHQGVNIRHSCDQCNKTFAQERSLKIHKQNVHDGRRVLYECERCDKRYNQKRSLRNHILKHMGSQDNTEYPCDQCSKSFVHERSLKRHQQKHKMDRRVAYICSQCDRSYTRKTSLRQHIQNVHQGIRYECELCQVSLSSQSRLKEHTQKVHNGVTRSWNLNRHKQVEGLDYICETCSKVFKQRRYLISHLNKIHKSATRTYRRKKNIPFKRNHMKTNQEATKKYSCDICSKIYKSQSALNNHLQVHEGIEYTCNYCTKTFLKKSYLKAHLQKHEGVTYPCDKCPKTFSWRKDLRTHQRIVHEGNKGPMKQYECFHCGKRYYSRQNFTIHILKHQGVNIRHPCDQCNKTFAQERSLKMHKQYVHDGRRGLYKCERCDKRYNQKSSLRNHILKHMGSQDNTQYPCDQCSKSFVHERSLKRHKQKHKMDRRVAYICSQCDRSYTRKTSLRQHIQNVHQGIRYECELCQVSLSSQSRLKEHTQKVHNGVTSNTNYKCSQCEKYFSRNKYLKSHILIHLETALNTMDTFIINTRKLLQQLSN